MKIPYIDKTFKEETLDLIERADEILSDFNSQGFVVTLRTLYYQLVSQNILPNTEASYKRLGGIINDARLSGLIDWNHLSDQTRRIRKRPHWDTVSDLLIAAAEQFSMDLWAESQTRLEIWIEKDALIGVIDEVCTRFDVTYFSCRGYVSQSEMWRAAQRLLACIEQGQTPVILHFGDHDPSGIDMTRDIRDRLSMFCERQIEVRRIALTEAQIEEYQLPPNPAKVTDSRAKQYIEHFGNESWELDAIPPQSLVGLVSNAIEGFVERDTFDEKRKQERKGRKKLLRLASEATTS